LSTEGEQGRTQEEPESQAVPDALSPDKAGTGWDLEPGAAEPLPLEPSPRSESAEPPEPAPPPVPPSSEEDEDIDIPAFLRRPAESPAALPESDEAVQPSLSSTGPPTPPALPSPPSRELTPDEAGELDEIIARELERVEKDFGRDLTVAEVEVIVANVIRSKPEFGQALSAVDQTTADIYSHYERITKSTKLKRFLRGVASFFGYTAVGAAAGMAVRTGVRAAIAHAFHLSATAFNPGGMAAGGLVGAAIGGFRGAQAEKRRLHGAAAALNEFKRIKQETGRDHALSFLASVLQGGRFQGTHEELLGMIGVLRRESLWGASEAGQLCEVQDTVRVDGQEMVVDDALVAGYLQGLGPAGETLYQSYRSSPEAKASIRRAIKRGAIRGAVIGVGAGLVSDLVGWWLANVRAEQAQAAIDAAAAKKQAALQGGSEEYLKAHHAGESYEYVNRMATPTAQEAILPADVGPDWLTSHGLSAEPTDFGNALKHAIYSNNIQPPEGVTPEQFQGFLQLLNYVKPEVAEHMNIPLEDVSRGVEGGVYHFDRSSLGALVDSVFKSGGQLEQLNYETIADADKLLTNVFPQMLEQGARQAGEEAVRQAGAEQAVQAAGAAAKTAGVEGLKEGALHAAGIGTGAALGGAWAARRDREEGVAAIEEAEQATGVAARSSDETQPEAETGGSGTGEAPGEGQPPAEAAGPTQSEEGAEAAGGEGPTAPEPAQEPGAPAERPEQPQVQLSPEDQARLDELWTEAEEAEREFRVVYGGKEVLDARSAVDLVKEAERKAKETGGDRWEEEFQVVLAQKIFEERVQKSIGPLEGEESASTDRVLAEDLILLWNRDKDKINKIRGEISKITKGTLL